MYIDDGIVPSIIIIFKEARRKDSKFEIRIGAFMNYLIAVAIFRLNHHFTYIT